MSEILAELLSKIKSQQNSLQARDERAVELGVVIPLLRQLGWDTDNMSEIYPQKSLFGTGYGEGNGKVDYALHTEGKCRVLMEVKRWSIALNYKHEEQLASYCHRLESGPNLAVLTNGRHWKFFLPPLSRGKIRQSSTIRKFLDIDIITNPQVVESQFNRFLARSNLVKNTIGKTQKDARALFQESRNAPAAESPSKDFQNEPRSVSSTSINLDAKTTRSAHTWYEVIRIIGHLMLYRHPETCRERFLSLGKWFSVSQSEEFRQYLEVLDLYVKLGSGSEGQQIISDVSAEFGYSPSAFTVVLSK